MPYPYKSMAYMKMKHDWSDLEGIPERICMRCGKHLKPDVDEKERCPGEVSGVAR